MRSLHEQPPQARVAALADAQLRLSLARDALPGYEPEVGAHLPVVREAPCSRACAEDFATCLLGEISEGFSLVVYEGGSVADLEICAAGLDVAAVYGLVEGEYVPYFLGVPEFANRPFAELFPEGVPAETPLTVKREGP